MKVHKLLSDPSKWTQDALARDKYKNSMNWCEPGAVSWCLLGAVYKCYYVIAESGVLVSSILKDLGFSAMPEVIHFNDSHTFEEVKALVLKHNI